MGNGVANTTLRARKDTTELRSHKMPNGTIEITLNYHDSAIPVDTTTGILTMDDYADLCAAAVTSAPALETAGAGLLGNWWSATPSAWRGSLRDILVALHDRS